MQATETPPAQAPAVAADAVLGGRRRPRVFYGWYMLGGLMGIHWYLSAAFVYGFGVLFIPILDTFGWSRTVGSLAVSFRQPMGGAAGPVAGMLVDRYGSRKVAIGGVLITAAGMMSIGAIQALWMLFASFALISIGMSATMGVAFNTAIVNWFHRKRGRALGIGYSGAVLSGPFVGVVVWMEASYGWRETAFLLGLGLLLIGIPLSLLIRSRPSDMGLLPDGDDPADAGAVAAAVAATTEGPQATAREALRDRNLWVLSIVFGMLSMGISGFMLHQIPYFESIGFSRGQAASSLAYFTLLSIFGRVGTGLLLDWMSRRGYDLRLVPAGLLAIQASSLLLVAYIDAYWQMIPFALLMGTSFGGMIPSRPMLVTRLFGLRQFATIQGILNFSIVPFAVIAPLSLGYFFDTTGDYFGGVMLLAAMNTVGIPLVFLLRIPRAGGAAQPSAAGAPAAGAPVAAFAGTAAALPARVENGAPGAGPPSTGFGPNDTGGAGAANEGRRPPRRDYMGPGVPRPRNDYMGENGAPGERAPPSASNER